MKEYEDFGHMCLVRSPRLHEPHYFIPPHCVFKPSSTSTKLRVVFDASCPSSSQKSLNDLLMVGPTIQDELYKILLRFVYLDESVSQDIHSAWKSFVSDLKLLPSLKIPRFCLAPDSKSVQLNGFCDSSILAYSFCFYFRVKTSSGNVFVLLFTAKSRKSLPKLELCGAQLLAKLYCKIKNLFAIPNLKVVLWTDSQLVLHWLKQHCALKCLNPFLDSSNDFNLLKVGGRLEYQKHPIILPRKCHFVHCYVRHLHISNYHAGPKALMPLIHQKFWIINSINLCRSIINSWPQCIRYRPKLLVQSTPT
ncbi:uncharacterized protein LOC124419839 [Lucilia cuprina]|uniref:uncharacterized protein LOC124419839 n=1 Tax=Lucilia cuprina TaxID=7375 RepID=UPI001F06E4AF|nr:uncharacterized protein LOC124419839 [Lucilia cuprina]